MKDKPRCGWEGNTELMIRYHDTEWGVPVHDDRKLFEFLTLDAFHASHDSFVAWYEQHPWLVIGGYVMRLVVTANNA